MQRVGREFWDAAIAAGRPLAIEPEGGGYPDTNRSADAAQWNASGWSTLGWAYQWIGTSTSDNETTVYRDAPGVDRAKWLEPRGRHLTHVTDRWRKQRVTAIQLAFFNANGYERRARHAGCTTSACRLHHECMTVASRVHAGCITVT